MEKKEKPIYDPRIFRGIKFSNLDYNKSYRLVIERVFERGDVEDIRTCRRYYGDELIKEILTTAEYLTLHTIYLAAAVCDNDVTEYKSYYIALPKKLFNQPNRWKIHANKSALNNSITKYNIDPVMTAGHPSPPVEKGRG